MLRSGRLPLPLIAETRIRFRACLGFVADKVALVRVILRLHRVSPVITFPRLLHVHISVITNNV